MVNINLECSNLLWGLNIFQTFLLYKFSQSQLLLNNTELLSGLEDTLFLEPYQVVLCNSDFCALLIITIIFISINSISR